jgi:1-acyl-sn-glycerol-3-phosphate acyltransferase
MVRRGSPRRVDALLALRSILFNIFFFAWTAAIVVFGVPALAIGRPGVYFVGRLWSRGTFALLDHLVGLRHRILGRERLVPEPVIVAVKHQSAWDTMICSLLFAEPAYVLKRELTWIPFFGWLLLRGGMIAVDRGAGGPALRRMIRQAQKAVQQGRSVLIFPEGTRTAPGTSRPYHPGVAALYEHLRLPVVPIALNSGLFWGRRSFLKQPGTITLEILEPIEYGLPRRTFLEVLRERIETASLRLANQTASATRSSPGGVEAVEKFVESEPVQGSMPRKKT